jgi:Uncharacterised nucleotidyltransferase
MIAIPTIQEKYTPEMALTILVCRVFFNTASPNELKEYLAGNKIDWPCFEQIITSHQVRPLIYKVLAAHPSGVDTAFLETLRTNCYRIATGNLGKLEEVKRLSLLLSNGGVMVAPYKGVVLSQLLFDDFISRETVDIDLIIDPADFSKAYNILVADGYTPRYYDPAFEKQILRTSHELQFKKGELKIEIHWAATNPMMNIPLPNADLQQDMGSLQVLGTDVKVFSLRSHLLLLLVHHGVNDVWRTLRHVLDICLFLQKHRNDIDWKDFHAATIKYKIRHTTEMGFLITQQLFGIVIPELYRGGNTPGSIVNNLFTFPAIKKNKLTSENLSQQLFLRDSTSDKIKLLGAYISTAITPNIRDMEAYPLKRKWYGLYYFIKPFRILFRKN